MTTNKLSKEFVMNSGVSSEKLPEVNLPIVGSFGEIRKDVAYRLFTDPSYTVFDAMYEMSTAAEKYVADLAIHYPENALWVGGSLGRREMLPNSDIDLFVIYDEKDCLKNDIRVDGVNKFEIGHINKAELKDLLTFSLVDANRFIDGRRIGHVPAADIEQVMQDINTQDRQLANNISEYFYYRYFDFPQKTTPLGPNLKYSTGSSRDTIFFNMISRMGSGVFPASRTTEPELAEALKYTERHYGLRAPYGAINLMFTVKNAAISVYDATGDLRNRYVSHTSLGSIYNFCSDKFKALGYANSEEFIDAYKAARQEIELTVDTLFTKALSKHPAADRLEKILALPKEELLNACINEINDKDSEYPHSLISFNAWLVMISGASGKEMDEIAECMMSKSIGRVWGGIMAVVCSPSTEDYTLQRLADWLFENEKGSYLTKLITRNPSASPETKAKALKYYKTKEIIT